jgi:hypothetical protein
VALDDFCFHANAEVKWSRGARLEDGRHRSYGIGPQSGDSLSELFVRRWRPSPWAVIT